MNFMKGLNIYLISEKKRKKKSPRRGLKEPIM